MRVSRSLGSSMKSVGEVMAIGRTFEEALQKAVRMTHDNYVTGFQSGVVPYDTTTTADGDDDVIRNPTDERLLAIADALANGVSVVEIHAMWAIEKWFLHKLANIVAYERLLRTKSGDLNDVGCGCGAHEGDEERAMVRACERSIGRTPWR